MFKVRGKTRGFMRTYKGEYLNFQFSDLMPTGNLSVPFPFILGFCAPSSLFGDHHVI